MSFKSIWALKLCYSSAGEVFKPYTFRAAAIRWKEFCTESRMLPCFPTVRNKGPLSLASGSQKKREVGTNASCPVALKGTSGMSSERFNKQRKHTESQGAEVQGKKTESGKQPKAWELSPQPSLPIPHSHISPGLSSDYNLPQVQKGVPSSPTNMTHGTPSSI